MNKFKKILVMMLVLVTVVTLFTVVAFASDAEEPKKEKKQALLVSSDPGVMTNEDGEVGAAIGANIGTSKTFVYAMSDDGNKYIVHTVDASGSTIYKGHHYRGNKLYSAAEYPYVAVDFDIAIVANDYASMGFSLLGYAYGPTYDDYGEVAGELPGSTQATVCQFSLSTIKSYLPKDEFVWSHVSVIFAYNVIDGIEYFSSYIYVNGNLVYTNLKSKEMNVNYMVENHYFGELRIDSGDRKVNTTNKSGYDNFQINFFNDAYTLDEIGRFIYNDEYQAPYGKTVARIGSKNYDSFDKAMAAAKNGDVIELADNIKGVAVVDKIVTIDTNIYGEGKKPTGEYYNISTTSSTLVSEKTDGKISFKQVQNASVEVFWDDCPGAAAGGECTCPKEYLNENGEHIMSQYVPSVMLNSTPSYTGEIPNFPAVNALVKTFVGWSYTQGGAVEDVRPVSAEDVERGYISLYPVYSIIQYDIEVTNANGNVQYFHEDEYLDAIAAVASGGTLKLYNDITVEDGYSFKIAGAKITIDLNGHDFRRFSIIDTHYNAVWDAENKTWKKGTVRTKLNDKGEAVKVTSGSAPSAFHLAASRIEITIKTSVPGANLYTYTLLRDMWLNENDEVVGYDRYRESDTKTNGTSGSVLFGYGSAHYTVIDIQGEGLSYYGACLVNNEWGGNQNTSTFRINGGSYYRVAENYLPLIAARAGGVLDIRNATFVTNGVVFLQVNNKVGNGTEPNVFTVDYSITNCVIIGGNTSNANALGNSGIKVTDCYYYVGEGDLNDEQMLTFGSGNYLTDIKYTNADALKTVKYSTPRNAQEVEKSFWVVEETGFVRDENNMPTFVFTPVKKTYKFTHNTLIPETDYTTVTFKNADGTVISAVNVLKNSTVVPPYIPAGDGFRAITNAQWKDAAGNPAVFELADADSYEFIAELPEEASRKYVADLSATMLGMSLYNNFKYNFYVPKADGVAVTSIGGAAPEKTVMIDGVEYYLYSVYADFSAALEDIPVTVEYTIEDKEYSAKFAISAYVYAMQCVDSTREDDADKEAAAALVRYIEEAQRSVAKNNLLCIAVLEKFEAFYAKRLPADYVTDYPAAEQGELNIEAVKGLIESIYFSLSNGSRMALVVNLTEDAIEKGYTVEIVSNSDSTVYTDLVAAVYTVSVVDADGNVVMIDAAGGESGSQLEAKTEYSMATYIKAMEAAGENVDVAKAFYALGKAVLAARPAVQ